jgi:hypothetical protein
MGMSERAARESKIRDRYRKLKESLVERARRLFVANEAMVFGYGGIAARCPFFLTQMRGFLRMVANPRHRDWQRIPS